MIESVCYKEYNKIGKVLDKDVYVMKMKKYIWLMLLLVLCVFAGSAVAQDEWQYRVDEEGYAYITSFGNAAAASATVPEKLDQHWVRGIDAGAFLDASVLKQLTIPGTVLDIDENAFAGCNIVLRGYNGTAALSFAKNHGMSSENLSVLDFTPSVVDLTGIAHSDYSYVLNGIRMVKAQAERLKVGSLFFMPADDHNDLGDGYQVRSMQPDGEYVIVKMAEAAPELILRSLKIEASDFRIDYDKMLEMNSGIVEIEPVSTYGFSDMHSFKVKSKFAPGCTAALTIQLGMSNLEFDWSQSKTGVERFLVEYNSVIEGKLDVAVGVNRPNMPIPTGKKDPNTGELILFRIPLTAPSLPIVGIVFTVFGTFDVNGKLSATLKLEGPQQFVYTAESGLDYTRKIKSEFDMDAGVEAKASLMPAIALRAAVLDEIAAVGARLNIEAGVKSAYEKQWPATASCLDNDYKLTLHGEAWAGLNAKIGKLSIDMRKTAKTPAWTILEGKGHYEELKYVPECTKKGYHVYYDTGYELEMDPYLASATDPVRIPVPELHRKGYKFLGWYDGPNLETAITALDFWPIGVPGDMTIYAHWEPVAEDEYQTNYTGPEVTIPDSPEEPEEYWDYEYRLDRVNIYAYDTENIVNLFPYWNEERYSNSRLYSYGTQGNTAIKKRVWADGFFAMGDSCEGNTSLETVVLPATMVYWGTDMRGDIGNSLDGVFKNCTSLKNITLPSAELVGYGKRFIGYEDFYGCVSLPSIFIPSCYHRIDGSAFYGCTNLQTIENLENTQITDIGPQAFAGCEELRDVKLPQTLTTLQNGAFQKCVNLNTINIPAGFSSSGPAFQEASLETVSIANGVKDIRSLFQNAQKVGKVNIPGSVTNMVGTFTGVEGDVSVTLEAGLAEVSSFAFSNCLGLTDVTFEAENVKIGNNAFAGCTSLNNLANASVSIIGTHAFENTTSLESLELTGDEITIESDAFVGSALKELTIRCNKLTLKGNGFEEYANLEKLVIDAQEVDIPRHATFEACKLNSVKINAQSANISSNAFNECQQLEEVVLSGGCFVLASNAFKNCYALEEVQIDAAVIFNGGAPFENAPIKELDLKFQGGSVFMGYMPALEKLTLSGYVDQISAWGFENLPNLKEIALPEIAGGIKEWTFEQCTKLEKVTFSSGMNGPIGTGAFADCSSLEEIVLPDGTTELQSWAFSNCTALTRITIPSSVTYISGGFETRYGQGIAAGAFLGCSSLEIVEGENADSYAAQTALQSGLVSFGISGAEHYTVTFASGISQILESTLELAEGQIITLSAPDLVSDGYAFRAWYYDEACTQPVEVPFTMPAKDVTVYAACDIAYEEVQENRLSVSTRKVDGVSWKTLESYDGDHGSFTVDEEIGIICKDAIGPAIERISIPASTFSIEPGAFRRAVSLEEIYVAPDNPFYFVENGALYAKDGTLLAWPCMRQAETLNVREDTVKIADHAFDWEDGCCQLENLYLPQSVQKATKQAFAGLVSITKVYGPVEGAAAEAAAAAGVDYNRYLVVYLSEGKVYGFMEATAGGYLPAIQQPVRDGFELYDWANEDGAAVSFDTYLMPQEDIILRALWNETDVDWFVLPRGLKTIGSNAFQGLPVSAVFCPGGVTTIESGAFSGNTQLEIIKLPATVTSIADDAFKGCTQLEIHGYEDSMAQTYALEHNIPFVIMD